MNLEIESDFYKDPERALLFKEERKTIPSRQMWALFLYSHPASKLFSLDSISRAQIIAQDYLSLPSFDFSPFAPTLEKIKRVSMTPAQRQLAAWARKFEQRESFMDSTLYTAQTYEMLDKMLKDTHAMLKQYKEIEKELSYEQQSSTHGDVEESLLEKGLI